MSWRDVRCGEPRSELVGQTLKLAGWVARRRDHGGLVFVDVRDRTGVTQLVVNPDRAPRAAETAHDLRNEFVIQAEGQLVARAPETVNAAMPTGEVELQVDRLEIVSRSTPLPFQLDEENVDETSAFAIAGSTSGARSSSGTSSSARGWSEPSVARWRPRVPRHPDADPLKPTPKGARDFLVPAGCSRAGSTRSRSSPQIPKQLHVVAGFDRYYQIAICFRDEDLRADRVQGIPGSTSSSCPEQE